MAGVLDFLNARPARHRAGALAMLCAGAWLAPAAASAQTPAARLSPDLQLAIRRGAVAAERVIVTASPREVDAIAARRELRVRQRLAAGAVFEVLPGELDALAGEPAVVRVSSDQVVRPHLAVTTAAIGADVLHAGGGRPGGRPVTGAGVGIAVIDSGIAPLPELRGRIVARVDFTDDTARGADSYGHGTHVAGIIAARPVPGHDITGVAPGAHLVDLKVLGADGSGRASDVIAAIDWAIAHRARYRIRILNLSLGAPPRDSWRDDPLCQAVERAARAGLLVVTAAGNFGKTIDGRPVWGGITTPGISPYAITVGAINTHGTPFTSDDEMASYSSRGPTLPDRLPKPNLAAPGNRIRSLLAPGSLLAREHPELVVNGELELSGTSMAAAVASGAAALGFRRPAGFRASESQILLAPSQQRGSIARKPVRMALAVRTLDSPDRRMRTDEPKALELRNDETRPVIVSFARQDQIIWGTNVNTSDQIIWGTTLEAAEQIIWGTALPTPD